MEIKQYFCGMDKKEYTSSTTRASLCGDCIHNYLNNGEGLIGCRAFPKGIPEYVKNGYNHKEILQNQTGDYVFKLALYDELTPIGKHFWEIRHSK